MNEKNTLPKYLASRRGVTGCVAVLQKRILVVSAPRLLISELATLELHNDGPGKTMGTFGMALGTHLFLEVRGLLSLKLSYEAESVSSFTTSPI